MVQDIARQSRAFELYRLENDNMQTTVLHNNNTVIVKTQHLNLFVRKATLTAREKPVDYIYHVDQEIMFLRYYTLHYTIQL